MGRGRCGREEGGVAEVEETDSAVARAGGDEIGLVWVEQSLVDARLMGQESSEGTRAFWRPLEF